MESSSNEVIALLDKTIAETKDLYLLNTLLDMKLISSGKLCKSSRINFDPSFIFKTEFIDFDVVCEILTKSFLVCENFSKLLKTITEYITIKYKDNTYQCNIVKLLNKLISFYDKKENVSCLFEYLNAEFVYNYLILALHSTETKTKAYETLISYFKVFVKADQIKCISAVYEFCIQNNSLDIFCALLNCIPKESIYNENCCFNNDNFWLYVESCVSGPESHLQKQGEYILTKYINSSINDAKKPQMYVANDFEKSWQAFFILVDIGREKQLHLVLPSLTLFKYICNLPFLWQKCVYKVYLSHSQTTIVYRVVIEILKTPYTENTRREIFKIIFPAVNNNEYTDLSCSMFNHLQIFCGALNKSDLNMIIQLLVEISWTAISFWKVIHSIFTFENKAKIDIDLLQEVIKCALNLPHVYIRTESIKYLVNLFWDDSDYQNMRKLIYFLKSSHEANWQYFQTCKFSSEVIHLFVEDILQFSGDLNKLQIFKICLKILQNTSINICTYLNTPLDILDPHVALLIWNECLLSPDFDIEKSTAIQLETFLLKYFNEHLLENTIKSFIELVKLATSRYLVSTDVVFEIIDKPIFGSKFYTDNQLYVALILLQEFCCKNYYNDRYSSIKLETKEREGLFIIYFLKNGDIGDEIEIKDARICIEFINLFFTLTKGELSSDITKNIIEIFTKMFEFHGNKVLNCLYGKLGDLIAHSKSTILINDFINVCFQNLLCIKKDQYFKAITTKFIKLIYSENYFKHNTSIEPINKELLELCDPFLKFEWIKSLRKLCLFSSIYHEICLKPIVDIYLQDLIVTKNERTEFNLCQEFLQRNLKDSDSLKLGEFSNPNLLIAASRLLAIEALLSMAHQNHELVITYLKERYMRHFKKRYFPDSKIHYEKLRILQAILVIFSSVVVSQEQANKMGVFVFQCIQEETNQNCIKQLLNWILIVVLKEVALVLAWLKSQSTNPSPSVLTSIMPTLYHLTTFGDEDISEKVINMALPWIMGAQFRLRLYSQDLITRILQDARKRKYDSLLIKYEHLENSITNCIESTGDMLAKTMKSDLIFLKDFHPTRDKALSTILYDIPRLNKVDPTEWQNLYFCIAEPNFEVLQSKIAFQPENPTFADAIDVFLKKENSEAGSLLDTGRNPMLYIQKKITPWKGALENTDFQTNTDFILIASLIDKAQNLGGLSRTCEVFGIRNIVFNDTKVINDKEFKSLSVSSESWINAVEVKVKNLVDFISQLQNDGYCVIGAEQTAGSKKLNEFQFPRKMALILGNEKTGIPPDIIPLLNVCLEIPQFGQTRSLNVHVAGATFIWEYAKQHLIQTNSTQVTNV